MIIDTYRQIQNEIANFQDIKFLVVTKKHELQEIEPLIKLGHKDFAENVVQEAEIKWQGINDIRLHLIGHLQSNKIKKALTIFDVIETIDSVELARKIAKEINNQSRTKEFYLQVNIGKEPQKWGILPEEAYDKYIEINKYLNISGVMAIPPVSQDPTNYFRDLKNIADKLGLKNISMGMSSDYKIALANGSTEIRIGSLLFE
jgi:pyridoxal phosphate enzyme (YggS family)